jgi:homoserine dehydrogenase
MHIKLGLIGFGNVLRAFADLLQFKAPIIERDYDIQFSVVGISTHSHGTAIDPNGLDLRAALTIEDLGELHHGEPLFDTFDFIEKCPADVMLEATWLDPKTGQPATDYVGASLEMGKHVVTANKGPVAFAHGELSKLARERNLGFFYESTVMDGVPIHSMRREGLLAVDVLKIRGVLNSTTNYILTRLQQGISMDEAIRDAQNMGVAETDPSNDIDGWDASIKIAILANTFMGADLRPMDVERTGIRNVTMEQAQAAHRVGKGLKLLCEAYREGSEVKARVQPMPLDSGDPLSLLEGTNTGFVVTTDILNRIVIMGGDSGPDTTAYGMLVDAINIARGRRSW